MAVSELDKLLSLLKKPLGSVRLTMKQLCFMPGRQRKAFEKLGWEFSRQSGSHMVLTKDGEMAYFRVPKHREVAKGTLRSLI